MITKLFVDGFKSLKKFEITFAKGLNVIIGPNGVGKTNICQALTILGSLPNNTIKDILNQLGGANAIFNKVNNTQRSIVIIAEGESRTRAKNIVYEVRYQYEIKFKLSKRELLIDRESLNIDRKNSDDHFLPIMKVSQNKGIIRYKIVNKDLSGDFKLPMQENNITFELDNDDKIQMVSLWNIMPRLSYICHVIAKDFFNIKSTNIDPNIARLPCDIIEPNEMLGNGKFLANALYLLSKDTDKLDEINSILEQALPCCKRIKPEISSLSLKRHFVLEDKENNIFPSNSLSDGTIKLLGVLVGVIAKNEQTMIIEEPENYLHPYIHRLIIDYLRETFDDGVCILTSHSETILNLINPEELIICNLENNVTKCKKIDNIDKVKEAISISGFGCGYHYVTGNFSTL